MAEWCFPIAKYKLKGVWGFTLQGTTISHSWNRKIIFQTFSGEAMLSSQESNHSLAKKPRTRCCGIFLVSGQIITTSAEVTPNGGLVRESPQNPLNSGLGIILICPEVWCFFKEIQDLPNLTHIYFCCTFNIAISGFIGVFDMLPTARFFRGQGV